MAKRRRRQPESQDGARTAPDAAWAKALADATSNLKDQFDALAKTQGALWAGMAAGAQQTTGLGRAMTDTGRSMSDASRTSDMLKTRGDNLARSTLAVVGAYGLARASLEGWVRSGLSGTTTADLLSYQTQQLGRSVASIFLPSVEAGIRGLRSLTDAFNGLTGPQQEAIRRTSLMVVGVLGAVATVPKLTAAVGGLGQILRGLAVANPFVAVTAGLVGLLSLSDRGREYLGTVGERLGEAFEPLAGLLTDVILPALENFIDLMSRGTAQFLLVGALATAGILRIISAVRGLQAGFSSLAGSISLAVGVVSLLVAAFQKTAFQKFTDELAGQVRAGKLTIEQAREEIRAQADVEAEKAAEGARSPLFEAQAEQLGTSIEELQELRRQRLEEEGLARLERSQRGRRDALRSAGGAEDPRATVRRLEAASVKIGDPNERTAKAAEGIFDTLRQWGIKFDFNPKPNPNQPVKGD